MAMRTLKTSEAAALLNVSPNTLRAWERRFGYPRPLRSKGRHRLYTHGEIVALRDALQDGLSISSAVSVAREGMGPQNHSLYGALASFELDRADGAMEAALAMRSLERAIGEILLPTLEEIASRHGTSSAPWALSVRWADAWLRRAQRLSPAPNRPFSVLIGDGCRDELDLDSPAVRTLELLCSRAGVGVLTLPLRSVGGLGDLLDTHRPIGVVVAGTAASDDDVARWAYAVRSTTGPLPMFLFRRMRPGERLRGSGTARALPSSPLDAHQTLLDALLGAGREPALPTGPTEDLPLHEVHRRAMA